jgi:hypothetical protein
MGEVKIVELVHQILSQINPIFLVEADNFLANFPPRLPLLDHHFLIMYILNFKHFRDNLRIFRINNEILVRLIPSNHQC